MRRILRAKLLASSLFISVFPLVAAVPAQAQYQSNASFDSFYGELAQYGDWVYSDRWGLVWQPGNVPNDFRPYYTDGRWVYTRAYGWTWASDYEWGDIAFHYGRWVDDPYDGWMWIPGYSWSPGWVVWRSNALSIGWMPMPPDDRFLGGRGEGFVGISFGGISVSWNNTSDYYGYSRWYGRDYDQRRFAANWTFVDTGRMADRDYRRAAYAPDRAITSIRQTTNITNYTVVNNYMVNRSVDVRAVERASGHPVVALAAAAAFKHPNSVMTVDAGQKTHAREFDRAPHGTGIANSAPPPPPAVINRLSDHVATRRTGANAGAGMPSRVFTKATIATPAATTQFHGKLRAVPIEATSATVPPAPIGLKGLHTGQVGSAPVITAPVPGTMTGPMGDDTAGRSRGGTGKIQNRTMGGPSAVTGPAAVGSPPDIHSSDRKVMHPVTEPVVTPVTEPVIKSMERKVERPARVRGAQPLERTALPQVTGPVTEPVVHRMERKIVRPATEPVVTPVTEPTVRRMERKVEHPAPVIQNPPPVVESGAPPTATTDEPKKGEHKDNGKHNGPN
jgi:hypothetical protein